MSWQWRSHLSKKTRLSHSKEKAEDSIVLHQQMYWQGMPSKNPDATEVENPKQVMSIKTNILVRGLTHESGRVALVSADLAIDGNEALHNNCNHFTVGQSIFQPVPQHHHQGQAFPLLVRSWRWLGSLKPDEHANSEPFLQSDHQNPNLVHSGSKGHKKT